MATARQKTALVGKMGMFMLEEGKLFTSQEYRSLKGRVPLRFIQVKKHFGNWARCLHYMKQMQPDIWAELQNIDNKPTAPLINLVAIEDNDEVAEFSE